MRRLVIGILAHVDAGKTTLAESMLYLTGSIRKLGRVDYKNAFLDTNELERARGITIFSKQAIFSYGGMEVSLLDTPGHVDFSAEMERTLQVLDYAVLVISGSDGVQGHTKTLWRLLNKYRIPTFIFINKMDLVGADRGSILLELKKLLNDGCIDFTNADKYTIDKYEKKSYHNEKDMYADSIKDNNPGETIDDSNAKHFMENLAMSDEVILDKYMESGIITTKDIISAVNARKVFPCYFGSALRQEGVIELVNGLAHYTSVSKPIDEFGAKVFKITRDDQGNRLTHMKITSGSLRVKMLLTNRKEKNISVDNNKMECMIQPDNMLIYSTDKLKNADSDIDIWEDKVDQLRVYSGSKYKTIEEAEAGMICAVTGLDRTYPGEGLGIEAGSDMPVLKPVLVYQIIFPTGCNAFSMLPKLRQLEEEDPQLHIMWSEQLKEIHVQLMGEIQIDILKKLILERFGVNVDFGTGNILYKETILEPVVGKGHFEPLRHYAEVHLKMEPGEAGSGLSFQSDCSEDTLSRNWQRLIITHLEEKEHLGVLTGSPITDMKITLVAGRAHLKHTEGGDFRQATYRAVRQGLKKAKSVLLEPYYNFRLEVPSENVGRAMSDIQRMYGSFSPPEIMGDISVLTGIAPVANIRGYQSEVADYTSGRGKLYYTFKGYLPCHNSEEVIEAIGYDSENDFDNPTGSVFCSRGTGIVIEWDKVDTYMHVDSGTYLIPNTSGLTGSGNIASVSISGNSKPGNNISSDIPERKSKAGSLQEDKELEDIFIRTFGPMKQRLASDQNRFGYENKTTVEQVQRKPVTKPGNNEAVKKIEKGYEKVLLDEYLLVDGYNIIFSWKELKELANENLDAARNKLMDILSNYQGFKKCIIILVFDAYKVKGGIGEIFDYHNIHVVYTKEAETADQYIEKVTHELANKHYVRVATSDALEQLIILGKGAVRLSANDLRDEILRINEQIRRDYLDRQPTGRTYIGEQFDDKINEFMEEE